MRLTYTEGWKVINLANEVFGFNGWSTAVVNVTCDFADYDPNTQRHSVGIAAVVRVTLRDGVYHEDTGYGMMENSKSKGAAFDKVRAPRVDSTHFLIRFVLTPIYLPVSERSRHRCLEASLA